MHVIFIPYGKRSEVELLLQEMEAQKYFLKFDEGGGVHIPGQIRLLPFGVYEYIFPKEYADLVLHTLDFDSDRYSLGKTILFFLRKFIKAEKTPEYKKDKYYLWIKEHVNIIPLGIRYDVEHWHDDLINKHHEAL